MRILFDATALGSGLGGDETYLRGMLEGLALHAQAEDRFPLLVRADASLPDGVTGERFPVHRIRRAPGLVHYAAVLPRACRARRDADLVHTITHAPIGGGLPYALTIGDLSFHHRPADYPRSARLRLRALVERQCRGARMVLTPSEFTRRDVIETYGIEPDRVAVVPNRVQPHVRVEERDRASAWSWLREHGVRTPFVLCLGNLHPRKNVARVIDAFARSRHRGPLDGVQLVVAGGTWWKGGREREAAAHAPEGSVVFLGRVSDLVRRTLLEDALALAYVSMFEGFGLPPIEAMAAGTAVVASNVTALPEVCGDAALLVDPHDVDAIAGALERVVGDEELRRDLEARGRARAEHFNAARTGAAAYAAFAAAIRGGTGAVDTAPPVGGIETAGPAPAPAQGGTAWPK